MRRAHSPVRRLLLLGCNFLLLPAVPVSGAAQERTQTVLGVVRDARGAPLAGADIFLGKQRTVSGPNGAFRLEVAPGRYPLIVRLVGYRAARSEVTVTESEPLQLEFSLRPEPLLLPTIIVEGERTGIFGVVGDTAYRAAGGATVTLLGPRGGTVKTDSTGRFAFPEAHGGEYIVRVTYPGYAERRFMVELGRGEGRELAITLTPGARPAARMENYSFELLRERLLVTSSQRLMRRSELERFGTLALCDIPRVRLAQAQADARGGELRVLLNGITLVTSLCAWQADEIDLIEFPPPTRNARRTIRTRGPAGGYTVIYIWERK